MNATKIIGAVLIVAGVLGLVYRGFAYTKERHEAKLGPLQFSIEEKETITMWASVGAIGVGVIMLVAQRKK